MARAQKIRGCLTRGAKRGCERHYRYASQNRAFMHDSHIIQPNGDKIDGVRRRSDQRLQLFFKSFRLENANDGRNNPSRAVDNQAERQDARPVANVMSLPDTTQVQTTRTQSKVAAVKHKLGFLSPILTLIAADVALRAGHKVVRPWMGGTFQVVTAGWPAGSGCC
mgnify:CR=1 FL=1